MRCRKTIHLLGVALALTVSSCTSSGTADPTSATTVAAISTTTTPTPTTVSPTTTPTSTAAPTTAPPPPAVATPSTCPGDAPTTISCFTVAVPVDPDAPTGTNINLAVTVRRADPTTWTAPLLSMGGTTPIFPGIDSSQPEVFPGHDMIWIDQRGAGRSDGATSCPDLPTYAVEVTTEHLSAPAIAAIKACVAKVDESVVPLVSLLDHRLVAGDISIVRRALGISTWAVYAGSAAADIALHLVDQDPSSVTAIVTRTPMAVGAGISPNNLAAAFGRFAADCAAAPTCQANGDLPEALAKGYDRLVTPVTSKTVAPGTGAPIVLDQRMWLDSMQAIGSVGLVSLVPLLLGGGVDGSGDEKWAAQIALGPLEPVAWVLSSRCQTSDYIWPGLTTTADDQAGIFKGFTTKPLCDAVGPLPQYPPRATPTSKVPVLAVLPSYDPRSSVTTTKQIFSGFADTMIIEVPGIVDPLQQLTDCFYATANAFLADPGAKLDASCLTSPAISTLT